MKVKLRHYLFQIQDLSICEFIEAEKLLNLEICKQKLQARLWKYSLLENKSYSLLWALSSCSIRLVQKEFWRWTVLLIKRRHRPLLERSSRSWARGRGENRPSLVLNYVEYFRVFLHQVHFLGCSRLKLELCKFWEAYIQIKAGSLPEMAGAGKFKSFSSWSWVFSGFYVITYELKLRKNLACDRFNLFLPSALV